MTSLVPAVGLRASLEAELRESMRSRDKVAVAAYRAVLDAVDNAGAVEPTGEHQPTFGRSNEVPRRELSRGEIDALIHRLAEEREAAATEYRRLGLSEQAELLAAEAVVVRGCLGH